jgi:hypothetical protein
MLFPNYSNRSLTKIPTPPRHVVTGLSWDAFGGCQTATIESSGGVTEMAALFNWLRYGVEIVDTPGRKVWWGFINAVYVKNGPIEIGLTLDGMANSVKVAYSYVAPGTNEVGTRKTTSAYTNTDSITEFGTIEVVVSQGGLNDATAIAMAERYLADHKFPMGAAQVEGTGRPYGLQPAQRSSQATVRIECKGWINSLQWRYATVSQTGPSFMTSTTWYNVGDTSTNTKRLQQFTVGAAGIYVVGITANLKKTGAPTDNLTPEIFALDGSGNPTGTALITGASWAGASLTTSGVMYRDEFTTPVTLSPSTMYGIVWARSSAVDGSNYFMVTGDNTAGYTGGASKTWNGSAWSAETAYDLNFRININALLETTQQIKDLETTYGDYITYCDIVTASGVTTGANRDGDTTVYEIMRELAGFGGPNDRRLLLTVTAERVLMVEEEGASTAYAHYLDTSGRFTTTGGTVLPPYLPPVGKWIKIKDFIPGAGNPAYLANATVQFLEGADWSISSGMTPRFRGQPEIGDLMRLAGNGGYE